MGTEISIIIPMHNEGINIYNTIKSIRENTYEENYEIIVVDDGSTDRDYSDLINLGVRYLKTRRNGPAIARNLGEKYAKGNILVFLDAHMELTPNWLQDLTTTVKEFDGSIITPAIYDVNNPLNKGYGLAFKSCALDVEWLTKKENKPYEIPMAGCACLVVSRKLFNSIGRFDSGLKQWGCEEEICIRSWLLGNSVIVVPKVEVGHLFRSQFPYEVNNSMIIRNILRLAYSHFKKERIKKVIDSWKKHSDFFRAYISNLFSDVLIRRFTLFRKRKFNDDWFFDKFCMNI